MNTTAPIKIKFKKTALPFYTELGREVKLLLTPAVLQKARRVMLLKFLLYSAIYLSLYCSIYIPFVHSNAALLMLNYVLLGLAGILLAFNCAHDCVHDTFSTNKKLNSLLFYWVFALQGVSGRLWKKRHIASHHIFPNVDGCDADIDDNPFMRLSPQHKLRSYQRYQHLYALLLYAVYTLHWIFVKDFMYLRKKNLANLRNQRYSPAFIAEFVLLKLGYMLLLIGLPAWLTAAPVMQVLTAFLLMHIVISLFFVLTLIISHLCMETQFPACDANGELPYDYYEHQLAVSLDYHPESTWANWIFGGFNSHTAHHLFPGLPHSVYTQITPLIRQKAAAYDLPYHEQTIPGAIRSHFKYLRRMGRL